ncbi:MAG: CRISPR-associated endonuclease Cas1 [Leptospiraceae bacterium]|nr:CRISPR-associated endonuclease Cas1 [Leptospiraceae bacterium]
MDLPIHHLRELQSSVCTAIAVFIAEMSQAWNLCFLLNGERQIHGKIGRAHYDNALLRKAQFKKSEMDAEKLKVAKSIIAGKIQNSRLNLLRSAEI